MYDAVSHTVVSTHEQVSCQPSQARLRLLSTCTTPVPNAAENDPRDSLATLPYDHKGEGRLDARDSERRQTVTARCVVP